MARRKNTKAAEPSPAEINKMFFDALADMAKENGLELETLAEIIRQGVEKAIKRDNPKCEYIRVEINPEENILEMGIMKQVVDDEPLADYNEINIEEDGTDIIERLKELQLVNGTEQLIHQIDAALRSIADGTYGVCEICGELIGKGRLQALPFAKTCIDCQNQIEQGRPLRPSAHWSEL